ncbi:MAG: MBOAT family O-acyltransferase [Planctomycetota bacterium]|jgi:alginate O-acetyltransferase complex protein AlgI
MLFTEFRFVAFFLLVLAVHWALRSNTWRKHWLLVASYAFYAGWDWRFLGLIVFSTGVDFTAGRMMAREHPPGGRKLWLRFSLFTNLGLLGVFKYYDFFVESGHAFFGWMGLNFPLSTLEVILPVGISFYTFQTLSYSIDVYRGSLKPTRNFWDFALFVGFFPQLVAGPIVRAVDFMPQLDTRRVFSRVDVRACLTLFLIGFIKKACVSDNLAPIIDEYFTEPLAYDWLSAWMAAIYYAIQIYCDFSGYSDMAIATAGLLGYQLCLNFDFPYFSQNLQVFWTRWHISLSSWLRDYLFVPLHKFRKWGWFRWRAQFITMVLVGLWHGAAWNFVIFGAMHGFGVITAAVWTRKARDFKPWFKRPLHVLGPYITFWFVVATMIVFRPSGTEPTLQALRAYLFFDTPGTGRLTEHFVWLFPALTLAHVVAWRGWLSDAWKRAPTWFVYFVLGLGSALALQWAAKDYQPFIYFQF